MKYIWIIAFAGIAWGAASAQESAPARRISRRQSEVLQSAMRLAETNMPAAVAALEKEIDAGDDPHPALFLALGNLYFQRGDSEEAADLYRIVISKEPRMTDARRNLGRALMTLEQMDEAKKVFQSLAEDGKARADDVLLLGHAYALSAQWVSAETAYRQVLMLAPENDDAREGLVRSLIQQNRYEEALAMTDELLAEQPDTLEWWSLKVDLLVALDRPKDALAALEAARRLQLADSDMMKTAGDLFLREGQTDESIRRFRELADRGEVDFTRLIQLSEYLLMSGQTDEAEQFMQLIRSAQRSIQEQDDRIAWLRLQADYARMKEDYEEAFKIYRDVLRVRPLNAQALLGMGDVEKARGNVAEAMTWYERAARIEGHEAEGLTRQAMLEVDRDRYEKAVELLEAARVYDDRPHIIRYLDQLRRMTE